MRLNPRLVCALVLLPLVAACSRPAHHEDGASARPLLDVRLIALNDFHGNLEPPPGGTQLPDADGRAAIGVLPTGGAAYLSTAVAQLRKGHPASVVVAAGDLVGASPLASALFHDEPTVDFLGRLGLEFSSVGNHEFDKGADELRRKQQGGCFPGGTRGVDTCVGGDYKGARWRYLSANVIDTRTGQSFFPPSAIKTLEVAGRSVQIGFIGLVLHETPTLVNPSGVAGLRFIDEADAANAQVASLKAVGVQAFVVLIHQGGHTEGPFKDGPVASSWFDDQRCPGFSGDLVPILARLDPAIRVVVSGHTHQAYVCHLDGRLVTSAGLYGRAVTAIDLGIDPDSGAILEANADNLPVGNGPVKNASAPVQWPPLPPDAEVAAQVAQYSARAKPIANRVVGRISGDFGNVISDSGSGETAAGDLIADAMLEATRGAGAQLAFINTGGIRFPLPYAQRAGDEQPGEVTYGELYGMQPFNNVLITLTLSGTQLQSLLAQQWGARQKPYFLAPSANVHYAWDAKRDDHLVPGSIRIDGQPLKPDARYRVTVNEFMAAGGDGSTVLLDATERVVGITDLEALQGYFERHSPIDPRPLDRIERRN